jgi:hypothetical protein
MFSTWLLEAIQASVPEPHSMVLSTVDGAGSPDARVLILKNIDQRGWHFATTNSGPKGRQIALNPFVALTFCWSPLGRQVRISGVALELDSADRQTDFRARPLRSNAAALLARQSDVMALELELDDGLRQQNDRLSENPISSQRTGRCSRSCPTVSSSGRVMNSDVILDYATGEIKWLVPRTSLALIGRIAPDTAEPALSLDGNDTQTKRLLAEATSQQ